MGKGHLWYIMPTYKKHLKLSWCILKPPLVWPCLTHVKPPNFCRFQDPNKNCMYEISSRSNRLLPLVWFHQQKDSGSKDKHPNPPSLQWRRDVVVIKCILMIDYIAIIYIRSANPSQFWMVNPAWPQFFLRLFPPVHPFCPGSAPPHCWRRADWYKPGLRRWDPGGVLDVGKIYQL